MANADTPMGLVPIRHRNGAPYNGACNPYYLPSTYEVDMGIGDPVLVTGTSNTTEFEGNAPGTLPEINKTSAAGGAYISGVIVGFSTLSTDLSKMYNPSGTERIAYVADDPDLVFEIQEDGDTTPLAATSASANADLIFTNSVDTTSGKSGVELDSTTVNTTATLQLRILRMVNRPDNAIGAYAKWEVAINLHTQRYTTGI